MARDDIAKAVREHYNEKLSDRAKTIRTLLNADLHDGPLYYDSTQVTDPADVDGMWEWRCSCFDNGARALPTDTLKDELDAILDNLIPGTIYYDSDAGCISTSAPEGYSETCDACEGTGDDDGETCDTCGGSGDVWVEPSTEGVYEIDYRDAVAMVLGKELANIL